MTAIAMILSARWILLLSVIGGFVLAFMAMGAPDIVKIAVLVVWCLGIVLPIAYLYLQGGTHGHGS
jgi:hypothetical protein